MSIIEQNKNKIESLCKIHNVDKLYIFGSVATSNFTDKSDIDFLVKFRKFDLERYFENYMSLKDKLNKVFNREVDLIEEQTLKNPILIYSINKNKELIYG